MQNIKKASHTAKTAPYVWMSGAAVLLIGGGLTTWWLLKKKNQKSQLVPLAATVKTTSSPASRAPFQCLSRQYPLHYGTCHPDVSILQRYLKSLGMNLGKSGRKGDGVDGQFGKLTLAAAQKKLGKEVFAQAEIEGFKKGLQFVGI